MPQPRGGVRECCSRAALLDARDDGVFDAEVLSHALAVVDAAQIGLELRGAPDEE